MKLCLLHLPVALLLCLMASIGCNRSNDTAVAQVKSETETVKAELGKANAELAKFKPSQSGTPIASGPQVEADRRAAEWVLRVDGSVRVVVAGVPHEIKKGEKLPDGQVRLVAVNLDNCPKATDEGRDYLRGLRGLQELHINDGSNIRTFDFMADMVNLRVLNSEGMTPIISDADLVHIKEMKQLKTLIIVSQWTRNQKLTDKAFAAVKDLKQLENLRLCNCAIAGDGIHQLEGHDSLRTLDFWKSNLGDAQLAPLASVPKLESLILTVCPITDAGLVQLGGMKGLKHLDLRYTKVTDAGVAVLKKSLPNCQIVTK